MRQSHWSHALRMHWQATDFDAERNLKQQKKYLKKLERKGFIVVPVL